MTYTYRKYNGIFSIPLRYQNYLLLCPYAISVCAYRWYSINEDMLHELIINYEKPSILQKEKNYYKPHLYINRDRKVESIELSNDFK